MLAGLAGFALVAGAVFSVGVLPDNFFWDACCGATFLGLLVFTAMAYSAYARVNAWFKDYKPSPANVRAKIESGLAARSIAYEPRSPGGSEGFTVPGCYWCVALGNTGVYVKVKDVGNGTRVYVGPDDPRLQPLVAGIRRVIDESL